jgi:hypothetical protein
MRNKLLTLAAVLALVAVLGMFYSKPLLAQVRAVLVATVDTPARVPYQRWLYIPASVCAAGISGCSAGIVLRIARGNYAHSAASPQSHHAPTPPVTG